MSNSRYDFWPLAGIVIILSLLTIGVVAGLAWLFLFAAYLIASIF